MNSPAEMLATYFINQGIGAAPPLPINSPSVWPVYINFQPPEGQLAIVVYDTHPLDDGRIMRLGMNIHHPGIQILVRAIDPAICFDKAFSLHGALEALYNAVVSLPPNTYTLHCASNITSPIRVGQIQGKDWFVYTVNCTLTIPEFNQ